MSAGSLRVGGQLLSFIVDVEVVAFMFFKVVDISRLVFSVLSLASVAAAAEEIEAVLSAMPLVMGTWSSDVRRFRCCLLVQKNHWTFPWNSHVSVHVAPQWAVHR
ncbi:hypothetical protein MRX96_036576 [Rhipicephalus microplus]